MNIHNKDCIKILYLHLGNAFGGAERTTCTLLKNINTKIFKITLITSKQFSQQFTSIPCDSIIWTEDIGIDMYFDNSTPLAKYSRILNDILHHKKYDLAFGMMHYASSLLACVKNIYKIKTKIVSSPRGPLNIFIENILKNKEEKAFFTTFFSLFCRISDRLVVPSNGVKNECVFDFNAESEKVIIIPNSIHLSDIQQKAKVRLEINLPHDFSIITTACRLSFEKNLPFLIRVFHELRNNIKAKLLIIGNGPEKENLHRLVNNLDLEEEVFFLGYQENPFKYIAASNVFVHTCFLEGFGNSILEAMACKVPVVATACPYGPGEIIENGVNGLLVGMNDSKGMIKSIKTILENREMKSKLSLKGYETASKYTSEKMVRAYEKIFCEVVSKCDLSPDSSYRNTSI
jgi:glycosyltransferase involved in cell wall biosynthesis